MQGHIHFINRFDAAKTCPEPWTKVDKKAKVLKVNVCHLTQFALFWTFEAENGIFEFDGQTNGMYRANRFATIVPIKILRLGSFGKVSRSFYIAFTCMMMDGNLNLGFARFSIRTQIYIPDQQQLRGPPAGIEPMALRFRRSALTY